MNVYFYCPSGHQIAAPAEIARRDVQCPRCGQWVIVPPVRPTGSVDEDAALALIDPPGGSPPMAAADENPPGGEDRAGDARADDAPFPEPPAIRPAMGSTAASFSGRLFGQPAGRLPPGIGPADPRRVQTTRRLAIGLAAVALAGAAPALSDIDLAAAPGWARAALLLATVQAAYVAWLLAVPDWSSLRVLMIVFGAAAAIYGGAALAVLFAPAGRPLLLDLEPLRRLAAQWCMVMLLLNGSLAGLCGAAAARWRAGK